MRKKILTYHGLLFMLLLTVYSTYGQGCPVNMGFESGSFDKWETFRGTIDRQGFINVYAAQPDALHFRMIKNSNDLVPDKFGLFPQNCPNGSGYSMRLGFENAGASADRISYTFTIPADKNNYSIIYNYAVVLQNPNHLPQEQPRFTAKVFNLNDNKYLPCNSFDFVAQEDLPGFKRSTVLSTVLYKDWSPVTIKLSGYAGITMRLEFTVNNCSLGPHFGYTYIDVNENCASPVSGNVICKPGESLEITAPYGFKDYRWFNADFSSVLGTGNVLKIDPVPAANTVYAVEINPYPNQGCVDTVYTTIVSSIGNIDLKTPAGPLVNCMNTGVNLSANLAASGSSSNLIFSYYTDSALLNRLFSADSVKQSGTYYVKATNPDGCSVTKPVTIKINSLPVFSVTPNPPAITKPAVLDLASLVSAGAGTSFSYWSDSLATIPVVDPASIATSGTYYIKATSAGGCTAITPVTVYIVDAVVPSAPGTPLPNVFSPNGDGINDEWELPVLKPYLECIVEVYSRSGQIVFRSVGYQKPWDGKQKGKHLAIGTYYYVIRLTSTDPPIGGSVTIIR